MNLQTEIYISKDANSQTYEKIDLSNSEKINMKYVLKDTTDVSKIYSTYSQSFTFPGTLHNQRIFGFVGNTKVFKNKTDSVFPCKIYVNGSLFNSGKLSLTEVREDVGGVQSFTANFTTTMLSLAQRMGDDLINDLPGDIIDGAFIPKPVVINWIPSDVMQAASAVKDLADVGSGVSSKYFVPLVSNKRVFQRFNNTEGDYLDNVAWNPSASPTGDNVIKSSELWPAVQFRTIIDLIKKKYNLDIEMPLETQSHYNDMFIFCNAETPENQQPITFDIINQFGSLVTYAFQNLAHIPFPRKYTIQANLVSNVFDITKAATASEDYDETCRFTVVLADVVNLTGVEDIEVKFIIEREDGSIVVQEKADLREDGDIRVTFSFSDNQFISNNLRFKVKMIPNAPIFWSNARVKLEYGYHDVFGTSNETSTGAWRQETLINNNAISSGSTKIDLFKKLPKMKCTDFLNSFFKTFNISVFDASPNDDKLYWLTPQDVDTTNNLYSKKEVDYTPYVVSNSVSKTVPSAYTYYNFKHATSKYYSAVNYKAAHGFEFGQTTYPSVKPTTGLNEYKIETGFSIIEAVPIPGLPSESTSYGFNSSAPTVLVTGEQRYKPNFDEMTIFFATGKRDLETIGFISSSRQFYIGFQSMNTSNALIAAPLKSYVRISPIHTNGFNLGFGLIQTATVRSLYFDFYKTQTERLLSANTLQHAFEMELPAKELILNFSSSAPGTGNVPDGFRLQNEIIVQETKYSIIDSTIDLTTGKTKINLLNF